MVPARSFLLTVHEPGSMVLEDLRTRSRVRITALSELPAAIAERLRQPDGKTGPGEEEEQRCAPDSQL